MTNDKKVSIDSKKSMAKQWMKGVFHQKHWGGPSVPKEWSKALWVVLTISSGIPLASHFIAKNKTISSVMKSSDRATHHFDIPGLIDRSKPETAQKPRPRKNVKAITFLAASSIDRPDLEMIPPGSMVKAILKTGASDGPVKAVSEQPLIVDGETVVPAGTVFFGKGRSGEKRLDISFNTMVFKSGKSKKIKARAADFSDKIAGLKGSRVGAYAGKLAAATGLNFLSGYADGLKQRNVQQGQIVEEATPKNALLNGASFAAIDLSREVLSDMRNQTPRIEVPMETPIYVLFEVNQ
jgi:hypothetical protein